MPDEVGERAARQRVRQIAVALTDGEGLRVVALVATADDVPALVRLRGLMLADMGVAVGPRGARVSGAAGACDHRAPGPSSLSGLRGHVFNVSTEPVARRKGYARACTEELLRWFAEETEVTMVDLNATADGAGLYESLGFEVPRSPTMRIRLGSS
ncbi:GNAT family N-acetyltransferase [Streptomyces sp. NBC_00247]|uniref:GNAT family N-acetyltransferase n=1 Tax=Streptomyces sp. NBC_00247 TaxID=2975689 RepID=UPI002E2D870C|nr:GNAT family N-acetyltransferase [Streptomyces sp. NBC_00247]